MARHAFTALVTLLVCTQTLLASAQTNNELPITFVVSPSGPYPSIEAALAEAQTGAIIEVRGGVYPALSVEKSVTLIGSEGAVIDGGGDGTVVMLAAPEIVFRGFEVRGSGIEPDRDHSGITVTASRVTVADNRLYDVLFGVYVAEADDVTVTGNDITSKASLEEARRGDGVRLWYSQRTLVENNTVHDGRDVVAWYSRGVTIRDNVIARGRYGIHLMYDDAATLERNQVRDNSVGIYVMYSKDVRLAANTVSGHRGPSGYAIGFKDTDDVTVINNTLTDNRAGLFIDAAPFSPQGFAHYRDNVIGFNDVGIILLPSVRRAEFTGNTLWENLEQVAIQGGGEVSTANTWQNNYWSDYAGFDADGDGVGDVPYRAERFFEGLTDREPLLRALIYSPAAQALEFAGAALPLFRPQPKLVDAAPRLQPAPLAVAPAARTPISIPMLLVGAMLLTLSISAGGVMVQKRFIPEHAEHTARGPSAESAAHPATQPTLIIQGVSKRYGQANALEGVSFTAQPGEAIALWGANGAGKTTLLKAILGLIDFTGHIEVCGHDVRRDGKAARRTLGYVPQDVALYEQSVRETLEFFARLKEQRVGEVGSSPRLQSPLARIPALMTRLGLAEHAHKTVSVLSGGLRQRLALAIGLLADPRVLLLDEPTANLDAQAQQDYLALLHSLRKEEGKTILFASHRLEEVELLANRVAVLEHGRLVEVVTPEALLTKLMPYIKLTLWVPEAQRPDTLARFTGAGMPAHLNGRGTVVVEVHAAQKMQLLQLMRELPVTDFEMERGRPWQ